ncbi:MAG: acyl-[acyl-carrier-protein] desaturase [Actinomycetota bacterium]|jgi:acyl-[acyl-carrier-protein] desaturase|nr:acyl-[acyl-carrier-protein] desaturase [Actinomycetota bacterium]
MTTSARAGDLRLIHELMPTAEKLVDRHVSSSKEWFPHLYVPWSKGRDFEADEEWDPQEFPLPDAVRDALFVNLLTEDNLPYYFHTIDNIFGPGVWGEWIRRWTAEEQRHSIVIRDYLTVTRALDPVELERGRMAQVSGAVVPEPDTPADTLVYVALQELATRVSHRNTGKLIGDPVGYEVMARVAADENLHYLFYRDLVSEAIALDPSAVVEAVDRQVRQFEMPGTGIHNFTARARSIARAGIYDASLHYDQVLVPVVIRHWKLEEIEGLSPEAEEARTRVLAYMARLESIARRLVERRQAQQGELIDA